MKSWILGTILCIIGMVLGSLVTYIYLDDPNYDTLPYKIELIDAYHQHYHAKDSNLIKRCEFRVLFLENMEDNCDVTWSDYYQYMSDLGLTPYQIDLCN